MTQRLQGWLARGLGLLAALLMLASAAAYDDFIISHEVATARGTLMFVLGGVVLGVAVILHRQLDALLRVPTVGTRNGASNPINPYITLLGVSLLGLTVYLNSALQEHTPGFEHLHFAVWLAGVIATAWGIGGAGMPRLPRLNRTAWGEVLLVLAITVGALVLRLWNLENSLRVFVDEIHLSTGTTYFWYQHPMRLFEPIGALMPFPRIFPYWISLSVEVFGRTFTGLRFVPAVIGALTVPVFYLLARELFDRRVAFAAGVIAATFPPFLHFGRIALINIADPLFGGLALWLLARAMRTGNRMAYALSGAALGLTQYFYEGGRLMFPALVICWLVGLGILQFIAGKKTDEPQRRTSPPAPVPMEMGVFQTPPRLLESPTGRLRTGVGGEVGGIARLILVAVLIALPLAFTVWQANVDTRMSDAGRSPDYWRTLITSRNFTPHLEHIRNALLFYVRLTDAQPYYGGHTPLILPEFVPLFLLGVIFALLAWRRGAWILPLWVLLTAMGNSLLTIGTMSARYIQVMPALALLMAVGVCGLIALVLPRRIQLPALLVAVGVIAASQTAYYFGPHLAEFNREFRAAKDRPDGFDAILRAVSFPPNTTIHLISDPPAFEQPFADQVLGYFADEKGVRVISSADLTQEYLLRLSPSIDQAFFLEAGDTRSLGLIQQYFPVSVAQITPYDIPANRAMVLYYYDAP